MWVILFKFFGIAIGAMTVIYLIGLVLRSARRLERKIKTFKEEQEALHNQGGPINPYAALAELYNEPTEPARPAGIKRRGKLVRDEEQDFRRKGS
jgi:hypothetical protein